MRRTQDRMCVVPCVLFVWALSHCLSHCDSMSTSAAHSSTTAPHLARASHSLSLTNSNSDLETDLTIADLGLDPARLAHPQQLNEREFFNSLKDAPTFSADAMTREPVPAGAYAVFDHHGHICILITLTVQFEITYYTEYNEKRRSLLPLPEEVTVSGSCARDGEKPKIIFSWPNFKFAILFSQNEYGNMWYVNDMIVFYNMSDAVFQEAGDVDGGFKSARMDNQAQHVVKLFASPVDKAYMCTSEQDLQLTDTANSQAAVVILQDVHIQPFVTSGQFGPSVNCPGGKVGRRKVNETVPLAVGSTLFCVSLATIVGYGLWRHLRVKKFNYGTMQ